MVICLYGLRARGTSAPYAEEEERIFNALLDKARKDPGFIGYHLYTSEDGEELGVIRFDTREALERWREDPSHQAAWARAGDFYEEFWVQNCETFGEYVWRSGAHVDEDLRMRF